MATETKRRRVAISGSTKKRTCELKRDSPTRTIQDIRQRIQSEYGLNVGKSTISDVLNTSDKWLNLQDKSIFNTSEHTTLNTKGSKKLWPCGHRTWPPITPQSTMRCCLRRRGRSDRSWCWRFFLYSRGWLQRFKQRHGLKRRLYEGETDSVDMKVVQVGRIALRDLKDFSYPDDLFSLDETALFFRLGPNATLAVSNVKRIKKSKDRITIALVTNATGTEKPKAFVIGKIE